MVINRMDMKKIFNIFFVAAALLALAACNKDEYPEGADLTSLRVALTPDPGTIPAAGKTFEAVVIVAQGPNTSVEWTASVDFEPDWVTLSEKEISSDFVGTYGGDDRTVTQKGISVTVSPNTSGIKRTATLRFTTKDGGSISYVLNQNR